MPATRRVIVAVLIAGFVIALIALPQHAASRTPRNSQAQGAAVAAPPQLLNEEPVPAFHTQVPPGQLPDTLDPQQFSDYVVQNAYRVAAHVKKLLYQQPCYCHCDQSQGHGSLLDCFAGKHGSNCNICMAEDFYTYEQSRKGKTAQPIREGIISGEWRNVDLQKYNQPLPAK
jgi:hypothetical protein